MNILAREDRVQDTVRLPIIVVNKNALFHRSSMWCKRSMLYPDMEATIDRRCCHWQSA